MAWELRFCQPPGIFEFVCKPKPAFCLSGNFWGPGFLVYRGLVDSCISIVVFLQVAVAIDVGQMVCVEDCSNRRGQYFVRLHINN